MQKPTNESTDNGPPQLPVVGKVSFTFYTVLFCASFAGLVVLAIVIKHSTGADLHVAASGPFLSALVCSIVLVKKEHRYFTKRERWRMIFQTTAILAVFNLTMVAIFILPSLNENSADNALAMILGLQALGIFWQFLAIVCGFFAAPLLLKHHQKKLANT